MQSISGNLSQIKPSITDDHKYIVFGDQDSNYTVEIYFFNLTIGLFEFEDFITLSEEPKFCSISPNQEFLAVTSTSKTYVF